MTVSGGTGVETVGGTPGELSVAGARREGRRRWKWDKKATAGMLIVGLALICAIFAPLLAPDNPLQQATSHALQPPSLAHLLGTDELGRDVLSRIIYGARTSMLVAALATVVAGVLGIGTGLVAGYFGRAVDSVIMRIWDAVLSVPAVLIGIIVAAFLGTGTVRTALALGFALAPTVARVMRAATVQERVQEYIAAAVLSGVRSRKILVKHILPNASGPIFIQLALSAGASILIEAALSYVGLGTQPPTASWGAMVQGSQSYIPGAYWYWAPPGIAIALLVVGLNFLADGLRNRFDPGHAVPISRWV